MNFEDFGKRLFFLGIGGVSMSALAILAKEQGYSVAGSDATRNAFCKEVEQNGISVFDENELSPIDDCDTVVYSLAISPQQKQFVYAKAKGKKCISRPTFLARFLEHTTHRIGIAGMHGKSTTTAMIAKIFCDAQYDPLVLCGANVQDLNGRTYRASKRCEFAIAEACEYRDAFLQLPITQALVLNIDCDHTDYFTSMQQIEASFYRYAKKAEFVLYCADDQRLSKLFASLPNALTFSTLHRADYRAQKVEIAPYAVSFDFLYAGEVLCHITTPMGGAHSVKNALAAAAIAHKNGVAPQTISRSLASFQGLSRRMEKIGQLQKAQVYSDYAHHPTELKTALQTARALAQEKNGRLLCVFQSHTYSRTYAHLNAFGEVLRLADEVCILPIFAAREENLWGVKEEELAQKANATYVKTAAQAKRFLQKHAQENDVILLLGAGDFCGLCELIQ